MAGVVGTAQHRLTSISKQMQAAIGAADDADVPPPSSAGSAGGCSTVIRGGFCRIDPRATLRCTASVCGTLGLDNACQWTMRSKAPRLSSSFSVLLPLYNRNGCSKNGSDSNFRPRKKSALHVPKYTFPPCMRGRAPAPARPRACRGQRSNPDGFYAAVG